MSSAMNRTSPPSSTTTDARRATNDIYGSVLTAHPDNRRGRPATNRGLAAHRKRSGLPNLESHDSPRSGNKSRRYETHGTKLPARAHAPIFMSLHPPPSPLNTRLPLPGRVRKNQ